MDLIVDTHALAWFGAGDKRFSGTVRTHLRDPSTRVYVSTVTAWEYEDLAMRGRLPGSVPLRRLRESLYFEVLPLPATIWTLCRLLPHIHRDPIDRMLVAHALQGGFTVVTADGKMRSYPVPTLW